MNCNETQPMLSGYMDGELNVVERLEIERHLQTCEECASNLVHGRAIHTALRASHLYHAAPRGMANRVLAATRAAERAQRPSVRPFLRLAAATAAFASALALFWLIAQVPQANREAAMTHQVTCSHVRSLMANHLLDTSSPDPQVVQTWFSGRLDYAPPLIDLKAPSYSLLGARLDYLNDRSVAALVYTRQKHAINLFIWPSTETVSQPMRQESRRGYRLCRWTASSMTFCAISDLNDQEMQRFAQDVQAHTLLSVKGIGCH